MVVLSNSLPNISSPYSVSWIVYNHTKYTILYTSCKGFFLAMIEFRVYEEWSEVVTFCHRLKLRAPDGKMRETDCANTEGILRIIQSIPSPRAEPFKRWLAQVGNRETKSHPVILISPLSESLLEIFQKNDYLSTITLPTRSIWSLSAWFSILS